MWNTKRRSTVRDVWDGQFFFIPFLTWLSNAVTPSQPEQFQVFVVLDILSQLRTQMIKIKNDWSGDRAMTVKAIRQTELEF